MNIGLPELLLALLALMLFAAAALDLRARTIPNWLNLAIALAAIPFWWAVGLPLWPDVALQVVLAVGMFALFAIAFAAGMMGGGDVKMLAALALWLPPGGLTMMLIVMSIAGGVLTAAMLIRHRLTKARHRLEIPYGVAIAFAGLWLISERILNQFG